MTSFVYDKAITDKDQFLGKVRFDVTVVDADLDSNVQLTIQTGRIRIPLFIGFSTAIELARLLTNAVCAFDRAAIEAGATKTSETEAN